MAEVTVYPDTESFINGCASFIAGLAVEAVAGRGRFALALSGGDTPRPVYEKLSTAGYAGDIDWSRVHVFFGDERCVPPEDARSNYRMAREALLDRVSLPPSNVHRIRGEDDPEQAALAYERDLQRLFRTETFPAFDLVCLGLGGDGHTASLFPGAAALRESARWVVAHHGESAGVWRVTFTAPLINAARHVAFLVCGEDKSDALRQVLEGPYRPNVLPAQMIQPVSGGLCWLVDAAAAARLRG